MVNPLIPEEPRVEAPHTLPQILVLGYGNTLRGDDGIGWVAAEHLRATLTHPAVTILTIHQLTMDLAEAVAKADFVFFLDASTGTTPGEMHCQPLEPDRAALEPLHHHMPPTALMAFAQALYGSTPPAWLYTLTAAAYDVGETLSPAVSAALPAFVASVSAHIASL